MLTVSVFPYKEAERPIFVGGIEEKFIFRPMSSLLDRLFDDEAPHYVHKCDSWRYKELRDVFNSYGGIGTGMTVWGYADNESGVLLYNPGIKDEQLCDHFNIIKDYSDEPCPFPEVYLLMKFFSADG